METPISQTIDLVKVKAEYDAQAKLLISHKVILAKIIKMLIPDFAGVPERDICEKYIQDGVKVGVVAADPNVKDLLQTKVGYRILPSSQDREVKSDNNYFDIVFAVSDPSRDKQLTHIYINLEEPFTCNSGYSVSSKAIYYLCSIFSKQMGLEFEGENDGKIKKCYSIWLCPDRKNEGEDFITRISPGKEDLFGSTTIQKNSYDKMEAIICSFNMNSEQPLLKFLSTLFSSNMVLDEKKRILKEEYSITMDEEMEEVLSHMSNLSEGIFMDGFGQGNRRGDYWSY